MSRIKILCTSLRAYVASSTVAIKIRFDGATDGKTLKNVKNYNFMNLQIYFNRKNEDFEDIMKIFHTELKTIYV